jgi:hypothetical protein
MYYFVGTILFNAEKMRCVMAGEKFAGYEKLAGCIAGIGLIALAINASFNDNAGTCRVNNENDKVEILSPKSGNVIYSLDKDNVAIDTNAGTCEYSEGSSAAAIAKLIP